MVGIISVSVQAAKLGTGKRKLGLDRKKSMWDRNLSCVSVWEWDRVGALLSRLLRDVESAGLLAAFGKKECVLSCASVWKGALVRAFLRRLLRVVESGVLRWFPALIVFARFSRFDERVATLSRESAGSHAALGKKERVLSCASVWKGDRVRAFLRRLLRVVEGLRERDPALNVPGLIIGPFRSAVRRNFFGNDQRSRLIPKRSGATGSAVGGRLICRISVITRTAAIFSNCFCYCA